MPNEIDFPSRRLILISAIAAIFGAIAAAALLLATGLYADMMSLLFAGIAEALFAHPLSTARSLPLAFAVVGLVIGALSCVTLLRRWIKGPLDVLAVVGTSVTVFGAIGAGLACLAV